MGFDLHGMNPKRNTTKPEILVEYIIEEGKNKGWTDWDKLNKDEKQDAYFEAKNDWEDNNPGIYFRNNVWWWRPLWEFICHTCDDILTEKEIEAGSYNDGKEISEKKANVIASRLQLYIDNGEAERWGKHRQCTLDEQEDEECCICEGTGKRDDEYVKGKCNSCQGKGTKRPFNTNYPFDIENVEEFIKFAAQSGGFTIC